MVVQKTVEKVETDNKSQTILSWYMQNHTHPVGSAILVKRAFFGIYTFPYPIVITYMKEIVSKQHSSTV